MFVFKHHLKRYLLGKVEEYKRCYCDLLSSVDWWPRSYEVQKSTYKCLYF